jgi:hypothetical protein
MSSRRIHEKTFTKQTRSLLLLSALFLTFCTAPAFAGQTITLGTGASAQMPLYGNGQQPYGVAPVNNDAAGNTLTIASGASIADASTTRMFDHSVNGGYLSADVTDVTVSGNRLNILGGTFSAAPRALGGYAEVTGTATAAARTNQLYVSDDFTGEFWWVYANYAYSEKGDAVASGGSADLAGGTNTDDAIYGIYGGAASTSEGAAEAQDNSITVSGGTWGNIIGGDAGGSTGAKANKNRVTVSGGTVGDYGGIIGGSVSGRVNSEPDLEANGNRVTVSGGTVGDNGMIIGGYLGGSGGKQTANDNIVTLSGNPTLGTPVDIVGGYTPIALKDGDDIFSGNTLNLQTDKGITVQEVANFEVMNVTLQPGVTRTATLLAAADATLGARLGGADQPTEINLALRGGADLTALKQGESITLISATQLTGTFAPGTVTLVSNTGKTYSFTVTKTGTKVIATLGGKPPAPPAPPAHHSESGSSGCNAFGVGIAILAGLGLVVRTKR